MVLHLKTIVLVIIQSKDNKDDNQSKSFIEASNLKRLKQVTNELPDRILEISYYPMTHNQKLDESFLKRWVANQLTSKEEASDLQNNFNQVYSILIGPFNPNGNFFAEGGDSLSAIQISHLINHPFPDQFQNSLRTKTLRNVKLDLSRLDEHFQNLKSKNDSETLNLCLFDANRTRLKLFENYDEIKETDDVIKKSLRGRWSLKTSSCADGQPIIFGESENELFGAISCHDGSLICFKLISGEEIFQINLSSRAITLSLWLGYICATTSDGNFLLICHKSGQIALCHKFEMSSDSLSSTSSHIRCPATFIRPIRMGNQSDSVIQPTQTGKLTLIQKFKVLSNGKLEPDEKFTTLEIEDSLNTEVSLVPCFHNPSPSSILICSMKGTIILADIETGLVKYKKQLEIITFNKPVISSHPSTNQNYFLIPDVRGSVQVLDAQLNSIQNICLSIYPIYCPLTVVDRMLWTANEKGEIMSLDLNNFKVRKQEPDVKMSEKITAKIRVCKSEVAKYILVCYVTGLVKIYKTDESTNQKAILRTLASFNMQTESWSGCCAFSNFFLIGSRDDYVTCLQLMTND